MRKSGLVIYTASGPIFVMSKVGDQESRATDFSYDFVFNFIDVVLSVNTDRFEAGIKDTGFNAIIISTDYPVVKPHGYERLGRIRVSSQISNSVVSGYSDCANEISPANSLSCYPTHRHQIV